VVAGLTGLLMVAPNQPTSNTSTASALMLTIATMLVLGAISAVAARREMPMLLAAGAGIALGVTAVLLQMLLFDIRRAGLPGALSITGVAVVLLAVTGVWLNQRAYRLGKVTAVLAVVTVADPAASAITAMVLGERFATDLLSMSLLLTSAAVTACGIAWLARSPANNPAPA
jgi:hypothetical protein